MRVRYRVSKKYRRPPKRSLVLPLWVNSVHQLRVTLSTSNPKSLCTVIRSFNISLFPICCCCRPSQIRPCLLTILCSVLLSTPGTFQKRETPQAPTCCVGKPGSHCRLSSLPPIGLPAIELNEKRCSEHSKRLPNRAVTKYQCAERFKAQGSSMTIIDWRRGLYGKDTALYNETRGGVR